MAKTIKEKQSEFGMILVTLIWGLGFPVTAIAIDYKYETFSILSFRFVVGTLILTLIYFKKLKLIRKEYLIAGASTAIFLFLGFYFQTHGLKFTSAANNAFLTQVAVIITPFLQWGIIKSKPSIYSFIAAFCALLGVFILVGALNLSQLNKGDILTLGCALSVSFHVVLTQYFIKRYQLDPILYTLIQFIFVTILTTIMATKFETYPNFTNNLYILWPVLFLGIFNTAFGFTMQSVAIKYLSSTRTSVIVSTEAFIGTFAATLILGDPITLNIVIGGILIIGAVIISETQLNFLKKKVSSIG